MTDELLTSREVCAYLRIHYNTFYRFVHSGQLKACRPGKEYRVRESDLKDFLENGHEAQPIKKSLS